MKSSDKIGVEYKKNDSYTIGEVSRLNNVTSRSLYHYEKIGMLLPARVNQKNGYRNYDYRQFFILDIIKRFKRCGVPLKNIDEMMVSQNPIYAQELLQEEIEKIQNEIDRLNSVKKDVEYFKYFYDTMPVISDDEEIIISRHKLNHILAVPCDDIDDYYEADYRLRRRIHSPLFRDVKFFLPCGFLLDIDKFCDGNIKRNYRTCYLINKLDFEHKDYLYTEDCDCISFTLGREFEVGKINRLLEFIKKYNIKPRYVLCEEYYDEVVNIEKPLLKIKVLL
jgi:DNA-binding transcriptional MerR regulator